MSFLNPAALLAGLLAIPIVLLYLLRLRRREVTVSSTYLWSQVLADREANSPWQRLRRNLLLLLQLLILSLLVLSLSRPAVPVRSVTGGSAAILLDATASMNARDDEASRFELALESARHVVERLPDGQGASLILVGPRARLLVPPTEDRNRLLKALEGLEPFQAEGDWPAAISLAAGAMRSLPGDPTAIVISDGGIPAADYPPLPGDVRFLAIGSAQENLAVGAVSARPSMTGNLELFVQVANYGTLQQTANLALRSDRSLLGVRRITLAPGETRGEVFTEIPSGVRTLEARLLPRDGETAALDALAIDDVGYLVVDTAATSRVLLVGDGNYFLEQLLASLPGLQAFRSLPDDELSAGAAGQQFDAYIFDGTLPESLPAGNLLLIAPPDSELVPVSGELDARALQGEALDHPLTEFLNWADVSIARAVRIEHPPWMDVLVAAGGEPLVLAGEINDRRVAAIAFDLQESDLPLRLAFPVLMNNLLEFLAGREVSTLPEALEAGAIMRIPTQVSWTSARLLSPQGEPVHRIASGGDSLEFSPETVGLYRLEYTQDGRRNGEYAALNLFSELESEIQPQSSISLGGNSSVRAFESEQGQREIWPFLASLAMVLLGVEWWVFHRAGAGLRRTSRAVQGSSRRPQGRPEAGRLT